MPDPLNWQTFQQPLADVAAAGSNRFYCPFSGYLRRVNCTLSGALAGGDATLTVSLNNSNLSPTIVVTSSGSAEGDFDEGLYFTPVKKGDWIEVTTDGGGNSTVPVTIGITLSQ